MRTRTSRAALLCAAALGSTALVLPAAPALAQAACDAPVESTTQPGYTIADPDCEFRTGAAFQALPGATAYTGIDDGQAWRIEVPDNWNGDLVVWAHGYRGEGTTVWVDSPSLRPHFLARGYAWAASSYQTNSYDPQQGAEDSHAMIARFAATVPGAADQLDQVIIHGASMGGHVTGLTLEQHPEAWDAGYPICGVLGDVELFDYFLDANVTAAALTGTDITYPADPAVYAETVTQQIVPELFTERPTPTETGLAWAGALQQASGGTRPGFASAFGFWSVAPGTPPLQAAPFLFGVYPGLSEGLSGAAGNVGTVYQLDDDPALSAAEQALNETVLRVPADPEQTAVPVINGNPQVPVLSLHGLGDLFVPFSMEQVYAQEAAANDAPFVSRAIRSTEHCGFVAGELVQGFDDLVLWLETGFVPAGDPITDPEAVASARFGCRFTQAEHEFFTATEPCPTFPDIEGSVHQTAIESLLAGDIVHGRLDGTFAPGQEITRGQVASLVARALGLEPVDGGATFSDIEGSVHADAIRALADAGIAAGYDDGTYRPGLPVTRAQLSSLVARALGVMSGSTDCFSDVGGSVHVGAICALAELSVVSGFTDGTFAPGQPITRAQTASVVWRGIA